VVVDCILRTRHDLFSSHVSLVRCSWTQRTRRASKPNCAGVGVLCGCCECRWLGGNAPEDHGSGLLNGFQTLAQETGVSVPKLDVVLGGSSVLQPDRLADHKGHGFGLGLADLFGGQGAAVATMQHFGAGDWTVGWTVSALEV